MTAHPAPTSPAPPARASLARHIVRSVAIAILGLALGFLGLLNALAGAPLVRDSLKPLVTASHLDSGMAVFLILLAALFGPILVLLFCNRHGWLRAPQLTALTALVLAAFTYLAWDEPSVRRPLSMDELAPALPGDEVTFQIFLRYAANTPAANAVKSLKLPVGAATNNLVKKPDQWITFLREHRAEIEAEWAALTPVRTWWDELAAQPRIGDLTKPSASSPIIAFQPMRIYAQLAVATASLQALDGHGDDAFVTLTRLYNVVRKFEPNSRTLVRSMVAKVIQKMALQAAGFVLDHATVSAASRAAFAEELTAATTGPAGARRLLLTEYAYFQPTIQVYISGTEPAGHDRERSLQRVIRIFGRLIINPRATLNLVGARYYGLAALAEARNFRELESSQAPINRDFLDGYHVKNLGGRLLADMATPALVKVVKTYWEIEDLRLAVLKRLRS